MLDKISIHGAKVHNLKNISLELPKNRLVVLTGLSGSGKSSLAFDTIYAEGQRRYVESLSAYARQFLEMQDKPEVEAIEGLSPAISIEQKTTSHNPRSTVGTVTEIYDYLRVLFARAGVPYCPACDIPISRMSVQEIVDRILAFPEGEKLILLAPVVTARKGEYKKLLQELLKEGFVRARVNGVIAEIDPAKELARYEQHTIEVVVDRLVVKPEIRGRLADSVETALKKGAGLLIAHRPALAGKPAPPPKGKKKVTAAKLFQSRPGDTLFSENYACLQCGATVAEVSPRIFSFNSPFGACEACDGLGFKMEIDPAKLINPALSVNDGAITLWDGAPPYAYRIYLDAIAKIYKFSMDAPFKDLPTEGQKAILHGTGSRELKLKWAGKNFEVNFEKSFKGIIPALTRKYRETESEGQREEIQRFMSNAPCEKCEGRRLKPASLAVKIDGRNISELCDLPVKRALTTFASLNLTKMQAEIAKPVLKEIRERLTFLSDMGIGYLTLTRSAATLSGGESQRIRLATQVGSRLTGVLYVLDEPSIGLHQKDNRKLLETLMKMRDLGNTVLVVEHDEETIRLADWVVDLGPGAGRLGGEVVAEGTPDAVAKAPRSLTGAFLRGDRAIRAPEERRRPKDFLKLHGCAANNLKNLDAEFPLGCLTVVSGVSGSGKSTLVNDTLMPAVSRALYGSLFHTPNYRKLELPRGSLDKLIDIDQSPIGRTPRSNPATYTGLFTPIRELLAELPEAKTRGYGPGRFSFNVKGGRCEACEGDGVLKIEMHFLADVYVTCETCTGKRYNRDTLEIRYKDLNIAEILEMTVAEALEFFAAVPRIKDKLQTLMDVGLGYIHLGQAATTLSGGEAQRIKLSRELSRRATGKTLYLLDEPTTGLHFADVEKLLEVINRLVDSGNTVIVIEHNLDVVKCADWIVDLGPEGGDEGGKLVASGTPEEVARIEASHTGAYLRKLLPGARKRASA